MKPNISVIMCVYKEPIDWIQQAIDSILNQTYKNFELIIVLDNPEHAEAKKLLQTKQKQDKRIQCVFNQKNIGGAMARHAGICIAKAEYIAITDADDISIPERLEIQYNYLQKNPNIDVLFCSSIYLINKKGDFIKQYYIPSKKRCHNFDIKKYLQYNNCISDSTSVFCKPAYQQVHGYRDMRANYDHDLWIRFIKKSFSFANIPQPLVYYRINEKGLTYSNTYRRLKMPYLLSQNYQHYKKYQKDKYTLEYFQNFIKECDSISQNKTYQLAERIYIVYIKLPKYIAFIYRIWALSFVSTFSKYHREILFCIFRKIFQPYGFSLFLRQLTNTS